MFLSPILFFDSKKKKSSFEIDREYEYTPCSQLSSASGDLFPVSYLEKLFLRSNDYVFEQAELYLR